MKNLDKFVSDFYNSLDASGPSALFEASTDTFYFAKDKYGRFVYANALLIHHFDMENKAELLGKTDFDISTTGPGGKI